MLTLILLTLTMLNSIHHVDASLADVYHGDLDRDEGGLVEVNHGDLDHVDDNLVDVGNALWQHF